MPKPRFKIKPSEKLSKLSFYPKLFLYTFLVLFIFGITLFILLIILANLFAPVKDINQPELRFYELLAERQFWIFVGFMFSLLFISTVAPQIVYHRILPDGLVKDVWLDFSKKTGLVRPESKYPFGVSAWESEDKMGINTVSPND